MTLAEVINEGLPRAAWSTIATRPAGPARLSLAYALLLAQMFLGFILAIVLVSTSQSFTDIFVPEFARAKSITYVRISSFSTFSSAVEAAIAAASRALDQPDVPLLLSSVKFAVNIVLDLLLISTFHVRTEDPTVEMQAGIQLTCNMAAALLSVLYFVFKNASCRQDPGITTENTYSKMAQTTRGEMLSSNLSSAPSTTFSVPESSPDFDPLEPDVDGTGDTSPSIDYAGYEGIDWNRLAGFSIRKHRKRARTGWVWEHGFDIENTDSGHRYWLCKLCHRKKTTITHMYDAASTSQANSHMEEVHHVCKGGPMLPQRKKQRTLLDMVDLDTHQPKDQALMNAFISSFDPLRFQHLLIRWVACDNIPFHKLESPYFRDLLAYANSAIVDSGSVPTHSTIRDWIVRSFNRHKGVVTELLRRSLSRINVSFDAWSSRKFMSLLGLTVHFLDDEGNFRTFLLGLPRIEGRHCGENLADRVSEILHEYGFEDRVGYFVTDNAESNDTCLEDLGRELGFKKQHRRLRCCGHIINLVARSILFGTDADAFEEDCQADKEIQDEVKLWRSKGPIGKLHNTVHWVERSGQRIERLHKLQSIENTALGLEDKTTYDVVMDNATRWNSSEAMMERAYTLRNALDSLVQAEVTEWSQYVARRTQNGAKPMPKKCRKKPTIVDDRMAAEDWSVIAEYLAILKPLKIATKRLEGRPREGRFGAIWEVLLTMEWLLKHLEEAKLQHERDEEPYLRIGCNLGWMKLDQYYALTEDSPAYLASLVLHPAFRWSTVESQWSDHPDWLTRGRTAVQELWEEYRSLPIEQDTIPEQPTVSRMTTDLDDFMASIRKLGAQPAPSVCSVRDEYAEWVASTDPGDCLVDDPIQYWLLRRRQYPRLSRMAIDLFSIPAMSSEPERIFSLAGQMVTAQRGRLKADLIGAAQCLSSWEKSGAIQISK
ncbi:putative 115 kDa protein in type-1 retrotransposable element R1DM [Purpureocillium lavendulum]|uniref:115 kDa protein in type-1 retrotransposable element R1DM n=2 Tax=Purpureocillium lavendulum TaxID=1247861 RepID=A0AB34FEH1_9HYPO|nr:putative 115 kDa protein in type-1 retrotransposable element R1DM [Purpureocillium lavendulum]